MSVSCHLTTHVQSRTRAAGRAECCDERVCLSVCLSVRVSQKPDVVSWDPWRQVGSAGFTARALDDVDGKERQIAGDEHREQDPEHLYRRHLPLSHVTLGFRNNILYATCGTASHIVTVVMHLCFETSI